MYLQITMTLLFLTLSEGRRLTPEEKVQVLDGHNWFRAHLPGLDSTGQPLPRAADMELLEWDEDLEAMAQEWADKCTKSFGYRECPSYEAWKEKVYQTFELANIGQNILIYKKSLTGAEVDVSSAVNKTYSLLGYYDYSNRGCSTQPAVCDSFTQMVWSRTRKVGCAMGTSCNYLVCNYHPQGNDVEFSPVNGWQKKRFAKVGEPCSKCANGKGWCWNNLCVTNRTSEEGQNATCAIASCEEERTVQNCTCLCPPHRMGNRCEIQCKDDVTCARLGFSACFNLQVYNICPLLCQRCREKPNSDDDWLEPSQMQGHLPL